MTFSRFFPLILGLAMAGCTGLGSDDEPPFVTCPSEPDAELIEISASAHFNNWLTPGDNADIKADITVTAPAGIKITGYVLVADGKDVATADVPSLSVPASLFGHGAHTISLYAEMAVEDACLRKAVFEDQQLVVFDKRPVINLGATLKGHITATSTSGETYERDFTATSNAEGRIRVPASYFSWTPDEGTAATLRVELTFAPEVSKISEGLTAEISDLQWNLTDDTTVKGATATLTWPNPATEKEWLGLTPTCVVTYRGTHEGIALDAHHTDGFIFLLTDTLVGL